MAEKVRLAMIGCGGMANGHLNGYCDFVKKGYTGVELVATCDTSEERARAFADQFKTISGNRPAIYTDYEKMLAHAKPDAVDIAVPHGLHHVVAVSCIEAGSHVMVEKPIGITVRASRAIVDAAKRAGKIAATAENIRRGPGPRAIQWAIHEKQVIGEPRFFYALGVQFHALTVQSPAMVWRMQRMMSGGWTVIDSGAHFTDLIRYLFGDVDTVSAQMTRFEPVTFQDLDGRSLEADVEDSWMAILKFKSGLVGYWSCGHGLPGHPINAVVYYGSLGSIKDSGDIFHGFQQDAEILSRDGERLTLGEIKTEYLANLSQEQKNKLFPYGVENGVHIECFDFVEAVRTGGQPEISAEEGMKVRAINDAIYESAATGQTVSVQDVLDCKVEVFQGPINAHWGLDH